MSQLLLQEKRQLNSVSKFIETAMERHHNREMKSVTSKKGASSSIGHNTYGTVSQSKRNT